VRSKLTSSSEVDWVDDKDVLEFAWIDPSLIGSQGNNWRVW
jgi:hypothetical protein